MGMFDYVKVEAELPDGESPTPDQHGWQSKDGPCDLGTVTITNDGRLLFQEAHSEVVPEEERPHYGTPKWGDEKSIFRLAGSLRRVVDRVYAHPFHGDFHFYDGSREFVARFTEGKLARIFRAEPEAPKASPIMPLEPTPEQETQMADRLTAAQLALRVRFYLETTPFPPGHPLPPLLRDVLAYLRDHA